MAFWSFKLAEPGHECVDLSKASDWFQVTNTLPSMLVELHMSGCELNQIPVGVANMTRLKVVNLRWNIIWRTIPQWLYTCSNFKSLSLYLNLLRGEISSSTGNFTAIVNLDLSANQIDGKMPNSLGNLCKLAVLDLSRNYFNGSVSEILKRQLGCSFHEERQSHARRLGTESKKRYHPVVTNFLNTLMNFSRLHDYMTDFGYKHKTYRALNLFIIYVITTDPANVEYILKKHFANYGKTIWHYHGACQVGRVVDKGYGVLGIDSLRVIDGSTFYHTPGANPQATVMMLGRRVHGAKDSA
ncbi:PREDICTED: HOTHEAD [Prunus dulcis]|uniref:PREDICTED: HOTHEAD n=1 Tax=Prunus dulcis TaxID=3755 RepID=A0A5E4FI59_PRUDU|nr:PREDICTED: HOTHEAD [Prunus dulcis]